MLHIMRKLCFLSTSDLTGQIHDHDDDFAHHGVELIEPSLYFRLDNESPAKFAKAFNERMNEL